VANIWLPIKDVRGQRETILFIPGASSMDKSQVQEIVAKQKEAIAADHKARGPVLKKRYSAEQVGGALREFRDHLERKRKRDGRTRYY